MTRRTLTLVALAAAFLSVVSVATSLFEVAPAPAAQSVGGIDDRGPAEYELILEAMEQVGNAATAPMTVSVPQFGQPEYDQIRTALEMANGAVTVNTTPVNHTQP